METTNFVWLDVCNETCVNQLGGNVQSHVQCVWMFLEYAGLRVPGCKHTGTWATATSNKIFAVHLQLMTLCKPWFDGWPQLIISGMFLRHLGLLTNKRKRIVFVWPGLAGWTHYPWPLMSVQHCRLICLPQCLTQTTHPNASNDLWRQNEDCDEGYGGHGGHIRPYLRVTFAPTPMGIIRSYYNLVSNQPAPFDNYIPFLSNFVFTRWHDSCHSTASHLFVALCSQQPFKVHWGGGGNILLTSSALRPYAHSNHLGFFWGGGAGGNILLTSSALQSCYNFSCNLQDALETT